MPREIRPKVIAIAVVLVLALLAVYPIQDTLVYTAQVEDVLGADGQPIKSKRKIENMQLERAWAYWAHKLTGGVFHSFKEKIVDAEEKVVDGDTHVTGTLEVYLRGLTFGLDLTGGAELTYDILFSEDEAGLSQKAEAIKDIIEKRINARGLMEPVVQLIGHRRLLVQVPQTATEDIAQVRSMIEGTGHLEFRLVCDNETILNKNEPGEEPPAGYHWYKSKKPDEYGKHQWLLVEDGFPDGIEVNGSMVSNAGVDYDQSQKPYVKLQFDAIGRTNFYRVTSNNVDRRLAIILDDVRDGDKLARKGTLYSAPVIRQGISGNASIEGNFTFDEAETLSTVLMAGKLPATLQLSGVNEVGPTLGEASIESGSQAIVIGLAAVLLFMAIYYLWAGAIADFALLFNIALLISALAVYNATLTLPGIAGIILTVGMSVDANVLIFERIREESQRRAEKPFLTTIRDGYKRAMTAIIDANLTTLFTAAILYQFGTGAIKGFAVTLAFGIIFSLFTALFVTRTILEWLAMTKRVTRVKMLQIIKPTNIPFLRMSPRLIVASAMLIALGFVFIGSRGSETLDTDFAGGTRVHVVMDAKTTDGWIRDQLSTVGLGESDVQSLKTDESGKSQFLIRTRFVASPKISEPELIPELVDGEPAPRGGGLKFSVSMNKPFLPNDLQEQLTKKGHKDPLVKPMGEADEDGRVSKAEVRLKSDQKAQARQDLVDAFRVLSVRGDIQRALAESLADSQEAFASITAVGPSVAGEMQTNALVAIFLSLVAIVCYIWFRFELQYGFAAIVALVHDVSFTLGALAVLDIQINLHIVAAMLTIIGYSLNDTIVVFDRVRENLGTMRRETLESVINTSINQTLSRTLLTSLTTLLAVLSLWVWGGPVIHDFSTALLIGVLVGTYSSVFIACPFLVFTRKRELARKNKAKRA